MSEFTVAFDPTWGDLENVDLAPDGAWVAVFRTTAGLVVRTPLDTFPVNSTLRSLWVRWMDHDRLVLIDPRAETGTCTVVTTTRGRELARFRLGYAVEDVLASSDFIVATYFDEAACGRPPGCEGLAVFDSGGRFVFGYNSGVEDRRVSIFDCYAASWTPDGRVLFFSYTDFPLVVLNLVDRTQEVWSTPTRLHGASAVSMRGRRVAFHSPYGDPGTFLDWTPGAALDDIRVIGSAPRPVRGLRDGTFLGHDAHSFTVIDPGPPVER